MLKWLFGILLLAISLAGCQSAPTGPQPPEIIYGQDVCEACGMILDEPKFASATLLKNGETRKFDDIGDMIAFHMEHPDQMVAAYFVHDYETEEWLAAEVAIYVVSSGIKTPMEHGIAAFATQEAAEKFASALGEAEVFNWDETRADLHMKVHE